jgi:chaperone BCS1
MMEHLVTNSVFAGGVGLIGFTATMALGKVALVKGIDWGKRRLLVSLEVPSRDMSYTWLLKWMESQKIRYHQLSVDTSFIKRENGSCKTTFSLLPGQGRHFLKYTGAWFMIERQRTTKMIDITNGSPWETITFTTLSRDRNLLFKLLNDAHDNALKSNQGKTVILKSYGHEWRRIGEPRVKKQLSSVVLDGNISEMLVQDVENLVCG